MPQTETFLLKKKLEFNLKKFGKFKKFFIKRKRVAMYLYLVTMTTMILI